MAVAWHLLQVCVVSKDSATLDHKFQAVKLIWYAYSIRNVHHVLTGSVMQCPLLHQSHCLSTILHL